MQSMNERAKCRVSNEPGNYVNIGVYHGFLYYKAMKTSLLAKFPWTCPPIY